MQFSHLHCHTQFSLLDGAASIEKMLAKAKADNMPACAITDHGNMFGVFKFVAEAAKAGVKPIVGCEFYLVADRHRKSFPKGGDKDIRNHQLFLAKNEEGYRNLIRMCSLGFIEGMYSKYPRIDKELVLKHHKGLIATTCCLGAEVPRTILRDGEEAGEKVFKWWLDLFGEDYYVELQRHDIPDQIKVNEVLLRFAKKYNVKIIASNDSHYVEREDANAHDILLCINTAEKQSTPKLKDFDDESEGGKRDGRFAFYNDEFYFKNTAEMTHLFRDLPSAIDNTNEIVGKIDTLTLKKDILLPNFPIPDQFKIHPDDVLNQWEYLHHLTYEGARQRYGEIITSTRERLDFELNTIKIMGFAGYFLIVSDFIKAGRDLGVFIGPGRGSAAGSAVAYCIGITNIDPIKYDLLFERFLNPDRKSMPDIDTDFDDQGRQRVIDYVVEKYGKAQVAQIITYGSMAAKMSIKDVSRVLDLPLPEANALAKLVPEKPGISLKRVLQAPIEGEKSLTEKEGLDAEQIESCKKLRSILGENGTLASNVLKEALILEGSVRNTGIHAAGIIIAPKDLTEIVPVSVAKDSDLYVTQFEGKVIEDAGVIKMDFLGLRNLTIIRDCLNMIEENHGIKIDIDTIPLDDAKTFELYQKGKTNGTFQFESKGMQKYLKELRPDKFEDLIAMNALYRPGPLAYIPNYINRKHGLEPIEYDVPEMEEYLKDTYGINVYQEQIMLLSQKMGNFTKGDADVLRKAMGKKDRATLDKMKGKFMEGCEKNGLDLKKCDKVWTDWEAFAQYAFNKSHSTCYAFVAYQTAYLKAHYPGEYMAAVLTHSTSSIDKITFFIDECQTMGIPVLSPDVNESQTLFSVNKKGEIRFGMGAIKGVGEAVVEKIIEERKANGPFTSLFDLLKRMPPRTINKRVLEALVYAGALDCFGIERYRYFIPVNTREEANIMEKALTWATKQQDSKNSAQVSMFGGGEEGSEEEPEPQFPLPSPEKAWGQQDELNYEKVVTGFFLSGHPMDRFRWQIDAFPVVTLEDLLGKDEDSDGEGDDFLGNLPKETKANNYHNKEVKVAGLVTNFSERLSRNGKKFFTFSIEDYTGSMEMALFKEDAIQKFRPFLQNNAMVLIAGKYQPRWNDPNAYELAISDIQPLSEGLFEGMTKHLMLLLDNVEITDMFVSELSKIIEGKPGKIPLRFKVKDLAVSPQPLDIESGFRITPDKEIMDYLKRNGVEFSMA